MNDPITNPLPEATTSTNWTYAVSLDSTIDLQPTSLTLTDGARCVMTITKEGRLVPGEGLSPDEATQSMFKALQQMWENTQGSKQKEIERLTDTLDMMRDEFKRIVACPGCNAEIEDLANRAQLELIQRVPMITQRDQAEADLASAREENEFLHAALSAYDWQRINAMSHEEVKAELLAAGYTQERLDEGLRKIRATVEKVLAARAAQEGS